MGLLFHHIPYHIHKWLNPILWWLNLILGSKSTLCLPCDLLTTLLTGQLELEDETKEKAGSR